MFLRAHLYPQSVSPKKKPSSTAKAMVAVPGLAALIAITFGGGVIGYRQANSGRYLRTDAARFLQ